MTQHTVASQELLESVRAALREVLDDVPGEIRHALLQRVAFMLEEREAQERDRCVGLCKRRADLWRKTSAARSSIAAARDEARSRANEAVYLADLLASGQPLPDEEADA